MSNVYTFNDSMQEKILAILWRDSESFSLYSECIKPRFFEKSVRIDLCRIIIDYYEKYSKSPTLDVLTEEVNKLVQKSKAKASLEDEYLKTLNKLASMDLEDIEYVKDKIVEFGKRQAMVEAIIEGASIIEKNGEYHKVENLVKDALLVGEAVEDIGTVYFETAEERISGYENAEDVIERIPTGKLLLDNTMKGGLGRTEMGVVVAPPGRGKTTWLIDIGAGALERGYNVFHYSLENSEAQILRNYDTRMLKKDIDYIKENIPKSILAIKNIQKYRSKKGQLVVKKWPTKSATVNTIKAHISQIKTVKGIVPDLIIIDYGALLKPLNNFGEKRDRIEETYEEIRALADITNCAVWTGAQGNRASLSKKLVTMADLAECFAIANIADFMLALCQTKKEKLQKIMRFFVAKNRDNEDFQTFIGEDSREIRNFVIKELVHAEEEEEEPEDDWEG